MISASHFEVFLTFLLKYRNGYKNNVHKTYLWIVVTQLQYEVKKIFAVKHKVE